MGDHFIKTQKMVIDRYKSNPSPKPALFQKIFYRVYISLSSSHHQLSNVVLSPSRLRALPASYPHETATSPCTHTKPRPLRTRAAERLLDRSSPQIDYHIKHVFLSNSTQKQNIFAIEWDTIPTNTLIIKISQTLISIITYLIQ